MNGGDILFDALNGVSDCFVLEAGDLLRIGEEKPHGRGKAKLWKTALLAAALALLLAAAAYAAGLLHWKDQTYSIEGTNRVIVVPNGLRGTKTYEGTAAWWTWAAAQRETWTESDWSFTQGDDALRKTCETYRATTPEAAAKLREIAETYGLELYSESFALTGRDELYDRSGMQPYVKDGTDELQSGYIFPDGSFYAEGCLAFGETRLPVTLQRVSTGALYPFGFPAPAAEYTEREYRSALGQSVNLVLWENGRLEIWYLSEDGEMFAALRMYEFDRPTARKMRALGAENAGELAEFLADHIDFSAVCENNGAARSLVERARVSYDPDAAARLEAFYKSCAFRAAREFQSFFTENFYGACFTGVYGQSGYEDISAKLSELAERYGRQYASDKTKEENKVIYDNGAFYEERPQPEAVGSGKWLVHYIPKTALYTRMTHYTDFAEYRRVWSCETASGQSIVCATDGPEKVSGSYLFYETDSAYVLVNVGVSDAPFMEKAAETIDWTAFDKEGDGK